MTDTLEVRKNGGSLAGEEILENSDADSNPIEDNLSYVDPAQAQKNFEAFLGILPPKMRDAYRRFHLRKITEAMDSDIPGELLEQLMPKLRVIEAATIINTEYPPIAWIVPDYLPPGLTIFSGRPKVGKSWLALQVALGVSTGGVVFGKEAIPGKVLYIALEDSESRLHGRMKMHGWPKDPKGVDFMLFDAFQDQIGSINSGGGKRLLKYVEARSYRLVIVDTFSRAIMGDQLDSSAMTEAISPLQHQALKLNIALMFIDHQRKNMGPDIDPIRDVFGSTAKAAVLDTTWGLYKDPEKDRAKLAITGRDVNEITLQLYQDQNKYWHCEGEALEIELTEKRKEILFVLEELQEATLSEIAKQIGEGSLSNLQKKLNDLIDVGLICKEKKKYSLIEKNIS